MKKFLIEMSKKKMEKQKQYYRQRKREIQQSALKK
jgi:hypothetical protein